MLKDLGYWPLVVANHFATSGLWITYYPMSSSIASLHRLVGHNLGLTVKDNGVMSSPQASSLTNFTVGAHLSYISCILLVIIHIIHF